MRLAVREKVNRYKFDKKSSAMGKTFGTIKKGGEYEYALLLFPMESNMLKINRLRQINNGRRALEAVRVSLFVVDGYINKVIYNLDEYLTDDVSALVDGLLMSFDPFTNESISSIVSSTGAIDADSGDSLREYFEIPIKCLLRIEDSIEVWTKEFGANGYFTFLEKTLGHIVPNNEKMDFAVNGKFDLKLE